MTATYPATATLDFIVWHSILVASMDKNPDVELAVEDADKALKLYRARFDK